MSWRDYLTDVERTELESAEAEAKAQKAQIMKNYQTIYRRLKTRCDSRIFREREKEGQS